MTGNSIAKRGVIRKATAEVQSDAADRLTAIAERLKATGMDGVQAWQRACEANPELAQMLPNDDQFEETEATVSDYLPRTVDPTPKNRSAATGLPVRPFDAIGKAQALARRFQEDVEFRKR